MLRVSIVTDEIGQDLEDVLDRVTEWDVGWVELRTVWEKNLMELDRSALYRARALLRARGLRVVAIASPVFKCRLREEDRAEPGDSFAYAWDQLPHEHLQLLDHALEVADFFGAGLVRVFSCWRAGEPTAEVYDALAELLARAAARAEAAGKRLALENEHACYLGTGAETARLLDRLPGKGLGVVWDPGNALAAGEVPYPGGYGAVLAAAGIERILHVHVKDARRDPRSGGLKWCVPGEGEAGWEGQLAALAEGGYGGALSIETHWRHALGGAPEATRLSLEGLRRLLAGLGLNEERGA